jgi:Histidine kinase-, DNA gyrase B-, and HSP90-like ATPase
MKVAILNIAINARDAMPKGGTLTISTHDETIAKGQIIGLPAGDYVALSFADTGNGMSAEVLTGVLEPFYTTKDKGKGTGLGLSLINSIGGKDWRRDYNYKPGGRRNQRYAPSSSGGYQKWTGSRTQPSQLGACVPCNRRYRSIVLSISTHFSHIFFSQAVASSPMYGRATILFQRILGPLRFPVTSATARHAVATDSGLARHRGIAPKHHHAPLPGGDSNALKKLLSELMFALKLKSSQAAARGVGRCRTCLSSSSSKTRN